MHRLKTLVFLPVFCSKIPVEQTQTHIKQVRLHTFLMKIKPTPFTLLFLPIDNINIELPFLDFSIWDNIQVLEFIESKSRRTGKEVRAKVANYKGLTFSYSLEGVASIRGSIHKFFNDGKNNATRFTYSNLVQAVEMLKPFGVDPKTAKIKSFEFGLNINLKPTQLEPKVFIGSIMYCRNTGKKDMMITQKKGFGSSYITNDVVYKFYDKSLQSGLQDKVNLLRYELRFSRMRAVKLFGISVLYDLLILNKLHQIFIDRYIKTLNETIFLEWEQIKSTRKLPVRYKEKFKNLRNPNWWMNEIKDRKERNRNKVLLEKIIDNYAKRDVKKILKALILQEYEAVTRTKIEDVCTVIDVIEETKSPELAHARKKGTFAHRIVGGNRPQRSEGTQKKKYCLTCGKEITNQRKDSKYCSDNRKCRDKAYNLKISESRKKEKERINQEIINLIEQHCNGSHIIRTEPTTRKRKLQESKGKSLYSSIVVNVGGKEYFYHGANARFFLDEFNKRIDYELRTQTPRL